MFLNGPDMWLMDRIYVFKIQFGKDVCRNISKKGRVGNHNIYVQSSSRGPSFLVRLKIAI